MKYDGILVVADKDYGFVLEHGVNILMVIVHHIDNIDVFT